MTQENRLEFHVACSKCNVECEPTEGGILCPKCGDYITDEDVEAMM